MLIEDNQTMVSLLTTLLKMEGYTVETPHIHHIDGFLSALLTEQPQLAFVDVNLRHGSGLELVRRLRQEPEAQGTRIIMSSGLNLKHECMQAGADAFLQKPFMPDDLLKLIHATINKKKSKK